MSAEPPPAPTPALIDVLRAADELIRAGLLPKPTPTPTLIDVLRAVDELNRAGLLPKPAPTPTLIDVLRAADELNRAGLVPAPTQQGSTSELPSLKSRGTRSDVVFFGDSVTLGAGASSADRGFVSLLERRLKPERWMASDRTVISAFGGIHGDLENAREVLRGGSAGLIVVEVGAHATIEDQGLPLDAYRSAYGLMLDCLQASGAVVVVGTVPWLHWPRSDPVYARADAISEIIRQEAAKRQIPVADIWNATRDRVDYISSDGIHPNDSGHQAIADLYWQQIESRLSTPVRVPWSPCGGTPAKREHSLVSALVRLLKLWGRTSAAIHASESMHLA